MKGVAIAAVLAVAALLCVGIAVANPPLLQPKQYEQFCEDQKISGTGVVDVSTSIIDKKIALEYYNVMNGDGDLELDQTHVYSQKAEKLKRNVSAINDSKQTPLNLYENTKMTYSGETPLVGGKYINSKAFYGGIGADIQEMYSVNEMEKDQTTFFSSVAPAYASNGSPNDFNNALRRAGTNDTEVERLMQGIPSHLIGIDTKNTFNGTWGTDAKWHKIFTRI